MSQEPLSSNAISHVGMIVRNIDRSLANWSKLMGIETPPVHMTDPLEKTNARYRGEPTEARAKLAFMKLGNVMVELIEPVGGPSTWKEFLDKKGEGVHHFGITVKNANLDADRLAAAGMVIIQRGEFTGGSYTYVDSEKQLGVILELIESA